MVDRSAIRIQSANVASGSARQFHLSRLWIWIASASVILLVGILFFLVRYFPFSERTVTASLRETFPSNVTIEHYKTEYFPHPGCTAEGVAFHSPSGPAGSPPVVSIQKLTIQGSYADFIFRPHHISRAYLEGFRLQVPSLKNPGAFSGGYTESSMTIGEVVANGAVLEFERENGKPATRFDIHELSLTSVSASAGMSYRVTMKNPSPPGEITSTGHFGPFQASNPSQTPVSGTFSFQRADLGVFKGISGIVDSEGTFSGPLGHVNVKGSTTSPDFEVKRSEHAAPLSTHFQLVVNSMNGDVALTTVETSYFKTVINSSGSVAKKEGWDAKFTSLDFAVHDGRIQDILRLFVKANTPPMSGATRLKAHVTVPPEGKPFLKEVTLQGDFDIDNGHFEKPSRQVSVDELSETARGEKKGKPEEKKEEPEENVTSHVHGQVDVKNGVATFSELLYSVPGADARMHGTFNLLNEKVDLHGTLRMDSKFSQSTSGIKALFAKVLDPFLNKKNGSVVPVLVDGTYSHPHFGLDLNPIKK
jgi:AsmA-like C-terminal region